MICGWGLRFVYAVTLYAVMLSWNSAAIVLRYDALAAAMLLAVPKLRLTVEISGVVLPSFRRSRHLRVFVLHDSLKTD